MLKVSKRPCMQRIVAFVSAMISHKQLMHSKTAVTHLGHKAFTTVNHSSFAAQLKFNIILDAIMQVQ